MKDTLPLSAAQLGIWLGQQLDPANPCYWTAEYVELRGELNLSALERAIADAAAESDALQMQFVVEDDQPRQRLARAHPAPLTVVDLTDLPAGERQQQAERWMQAQLQQPARLDRDVLWRCAVLRLQPDVHLWLLQAHHIVLDGFGFSLLMRRVAAGYGTHAAQSADVCARWPAVRPLHSFEPVLISDQQYSTSPQHSLDRNFWRTLMSDLPAPARLAAAHPVSHSVVRHTARIDHDSLQQWQRAARLHNVDWFCWLNAAVALWLHDQTGRAAITLGIPVMNRLGSPALNVACMQMNIVPLPLQIDRQLPFSALVMQVQQRWQSMRPHLRYRYEQMKQDLALHQQQRLFGPVVNLMPFERPLQFADLQAQVHPLSAGPVEDLAINILPQRDGCLVRLEGNPASYTSVALAAHMDTLLRQLQACARADHRPLHARIGHRYVEHFLLRGIDSVGSVTTVCEQLLRRVQQQPHATAISTPLGARMGYGQLLAAVQTLAGTLALQGIGSGDRVALLLPREPDTIVAMLAVLWTGAAYIPLDTQGPAQRRQRILQHAAPRALITRSNLLPPDLPEPLSLILLDQLSRQVPTPLPLINPRKVDDTAPAYLIYTSGSTGTPNGVVVTHAALAHFVSAASVRYRITEQDRVLQFAPLHFDASVEEIFLTLMNGAHLILRDDDMLTSWPAFLAFCEQHRISVLDLPTALWHEWVFAIEHQTALPPDCIRTVIIGGEAALPAQVMLWRRRVPGSIRLINTYGPTETTVVCTSADLAGPDTHANADTVTIGTPLSGVACLILDADLLPVPHGEPGELCILGPTLAQGYWQDSALTAQRFVTLQHWPGKPRVYRSGDRVRRAENGDPIHLGRLDDEVKISGQRIAPASVEAVLTSHPAVKECAVLAVQQTTQLQLVAFVGTDTALNTSSVRQWLQTRLLPAAIPAQLIFLPRLPRNANNKIDRKELLHLWEQDHAHTWTNASTQSDVSLSPLEQQIAEIWHSVIGVKPATAQDDFFTLGGKSLQVIQLANRLGSRFAVPIPAVLIFRQPSLTAMADAIAALSAAADADVPTIEASAAALAPLVELQAGTGAPIFCLHPADGMSWCYLGLAQHLPHQRLIGIQSPALRGNPPADYESVIAHYLELIRGAQSHGPYHLLGWSSGGALAHSLAAALQQQGETVTSLFLLDAFPADHWRDAPTPTRRDALLMLLDDIAHAHDEQGRDRNETDLFACLQRPGGSLSGFDAKTLERLIDTALCNMQLFRSARHPVFSGDILFFRANQRTPDQPDWHSWRPYVQGNIDIVSLDCNHFAIHQRGPMSSISRVIAQRQARQSHLLRENA